MESENLKHHFSVPGLAAKPRIDMIAVVRDLFFPKSQLRAIGYTYRGGFSIPLRRSFTIRTPNRDVNLHVFEENDPEIDLNILFRDHLRKHPSSREGYEALKYNLIAEKSSHEKNASMYRGYTLGKYDFIQNVLKQTGFNKHRFVLCAHYSEWDAAKQFRQKYFFAPRHVDDPYTWTFDHPQHKHLIFYQGVEFIGYTHIQLWPNERACMRMIVIDEAKRNKNFGGKFLRICEKWLKGQGCKSIHAESSPAALAFYRQHGYIDMPSNDPDGHESSPEDTAVGKQFN